MTVITGSRLAEIVAEIAAKKMEPITILEAGCGRLSHWSYPTGAIVSGVDISSDQLEKNEHIQEKFLGDVQTWQTDRQWDVVVSVYVLEHVADPSQALANMLSWTKPGGLVVVAVPNALSLKGLVTKMTPFSFHGWFYRNIYRRPHAIFPTVMDWSITPTNLRKQLVGQEIVLERFTQETLSKAFNAPYQLLVGLLRVLTLGRWQAGNSNYLLVAKKAD